jgi:hypothetical protein
MVNISRWKSVEVAEGRAEVRIAPLSRKSEAVEDFMKAWCRRKIYGVTTGLECSPIR